MPEWHAPCVPRRDYDELQARETALVEGIRKAIRDLEGGDCTFWACEGVDAPDVPMKTCSRCAAVKDLRALVGVVEAEPDGSAALEDLNWQTLEDNAAAPDGSEQ